MIFYGLDKSIVRENSVLEGEYYKYSLGGSVEVTTAKKRHVNEVLARNLSSNIKEDKMMLRYYPINEVRFKKEFLESSDNVNLASCYICRESCSVMVGNIEDYPINNGILTFSSKLSLNNKIDGSRYIYSNSQTKDYIRNKVRVLACGVQDNGLLALYYIPCERGLALGCDDGGLCLSAKSLMLKDYASWNKYTLEDWFKNTKVCEI